MISQRTIEEIKERANLIEIVGETVQLKRSGANYSGLCPFHSEDSASFHVRENGKHYHCFGCGASGNVISFIMESHGVSFPDAVEELAARYGIEVLRDGKRQPDEGPQKDVLFKINQVAFDFYRQMYGRADPRVHEYVTSRSLNAEALEYFGVGFAPAAWGTLSQYLQSAKFPVEQLLISGLVRRSPRGELFDTFRGRLIFPIAIEGKKIAGFGGRLIPALADPNAQRSAPKYLNSPESPIYQKNKILYGLPQALETIRRKKEVYLVEGYMDVIGLWQVGVRNVLAPCGTAVSDSHAKRLQHLVERVIVLFDGDAAGRAAASRCFEIFLNSGIEVAAVFLPEDEDPDTISLRHGEATERYLTELPRVPLIDCFIDGLLAKSGWREMKELGSAAKGKIAEEVVRVLAKIRNAIEQDETTQRAALRLLVEPAKLAQLLEGKISLSAGVESTKGPEVSSASIRKSIDQLPALDRELLFAIMAGKEKFVDLVLRDPGLCEILDATTLSFVEELSQILGQTPHDSERKPLIKSLLLDLGDSWTSHWRRAYEMLKDEGVNFEGSFEQCRVFVKKTKLKQALIEIDRQVSEASEEQRALLLREKVTVKRQLERLSANNSGQSADL